MALPYYLELGMTEEQYWKGTPYLTVIYRELSLREKEEKNYFLWMQGMYIYEAFGTVLYNAFRKKGSKAATYAKEPYRLRPLTKVEKAAEAEKERQKAIASLNAWKDAWDRNHG